MTAALLYALVLNKAEQWSSTTAVGVFDRLVRQMLEAKQKSEAEAEEQRRKTQQSALAKYRQAWASDTEVLSMSVNMSLWNTTVVASTCMQLQIQRILAALRQHTACATIITACLP